jgi:hypothetical protein
LHVLGSDVGLHGQNRSGRGHDHDGGEHQLPQGHLLDVCNERAAEYISRYSSAGAASHHLAHVPKAFRHNIDHIERGRGALAKETR